MAPDVTTRSRAIMCRVLQIRLLPFVDCTPVRLVWIQNAVPGSNRIGCMGPGRSGCTLNLNTLRRLVAHEGPNDLSLGFLPVVSHR